MSAINRDDVYKALASWDWQELYLPVHFKELVDDIPDYPRWIPVKFRPMTEEERYDGYLDTDLCYWEDVDTDENNGFCLASDVLAWMELPLPWNMKGVSE